MIILCPFYLIIYLLSFRPTFLLFHVSRLPVCTRDSTAACYCYSCESSEKFAIDEESPGTQQDQPNDSCDQPGIIWPVMLCYSCESSEQFAIDEESPETQHDLPNDSCHQPNVPVKVEQASGEGGREVGVDRGSQTRLLRGIMMLIR